MGRPRKVIARGKLLELPERFALHFRALLERHAWTSIDVAERLKTAGLPIGPRAIDAWLRGSKMPRARDLERIGRALGLSDYRKILPPPV